MGRVEVKGLKFHAFHGCHPEESKVGGPFEVDICVSLSLFAAAESDNIEDALDYVSLMNIAAARMSVRCNLIEAVAKGIASDVKDACPEAEKVEVTVKKLSPPVSHHLEYVSVTITI